MKPAQNLRPGARIEVALDWMLTDDQARVKFEDWARRTGRAPFLDWDSIRIERIWDKRRLVVRARMR